MASSPKSSSAPLTAATILIELSDSDKSSDQNEVIELSDNDKSAENEDVTVEASENEQSPTCSWRVPIRKEEIETHIEVETTVTDVSDVDKEKGQIDVSPAPPDTDKNVNDKNVNEVVDKEVEPTEVSDVDKEKARKDPEPPSDSDKNPQKEAPSTTTAVAPAVKPAAVPRFPHPAPVYIPGPYAYPMVVPHPAPPGYAPHRHAPVRVGKTEEGPYALAQVRKPTLRKRKIPPKKVKKVSFGVPAQGQNAHSPGLVPAPAAARPVDKKQKVSDASVLIALSKRKHRPDPVVVPTEPTQPPPPDPAVLSEMIKREFHDMLFDLLKFRSKHGHCRWPMEDESDPMTKWIKWVRKERRMLEREEITESDFLCQDRIDVLDSIGFIWDGGHPKRQALWDRQFEKLVEYKKEHGDFNVPYRTELGRWVRSNREKYHLAQKKLEGGKRPRGALPPDRIARLESIGFPWTAGQPRGWEANYEELVAYKNRVGDCNVSQKNKDHEQLGKWVSTQRCEYSNMLKGKKTRLTEERIEKLNALSFEWDRSGSRCESFDVVFERLVAYKKEKGNCNVPRGYKRDRRLGGWVSRMRRLKNSGQLSGELTPERVAKLESIGFVWETPQDKQKDNVYYEENNRY